MFSHELSYDLIIFFLVIYIHYLHLPFIIKNQVFSSLSSILNFNL